MPYGLGWTGGNNQIPFDNLIFKQAPAWNGTLNVTSDALADADQRIHLRREPEQSDTRSD